MKNYSDLTDIDSRLQVKLILEPVGVPEVSVIVGQTHGGGKLFKPAVFEVELDLFKSFFVEIELKNKDYHAENETAVVIKTLQIDGIDLMPKFNYLASYINEHDNNNPTSYLGQNGKWTLTFDRPFYQWLHQATGQGWLLG
jgi:hypothetical protein